MEGLQCSFSKESVGKGILPDELLKDVAFRTQKELLGCWIDASTQSPSEELTSNIKRGLVKYFYAEKNTGKFRNQLEKSVIKTILLNAFGELSSKEKQYISHTFGEEMRVTLMGEELDISGFQKLLTVTPEYSNKFEELEKLGFSSNMKDFLYGGNDVQGFFNLLFNNKVRYPVSCEENIRKFLLFLMDMETSGGIQLKNTQGSTAISYTQTLNEKHANRAEGKFSSLDTRIRTAAIFLNNGKLPLSNTNLNINLKDRPDLQWLQNAWNQAGKEGGMKNISFDDELKLTLIFLATKRPRAMKDIILHYRNRDKIANAAKSLYAAHHTNIKHFSTEQRLGNYLTKYFL